MKGYISSGGLKNAIDIDEANCLGNGAMGFVYAINTQAYRELVAKIYKEPAKFNREKIEAMLSNPPESISVKVDGSIYPQYAWPTHVISNDLGRAIGYLMPEVNRKQSLRLDYFYDRTLISDLNDIEERSLTYKLRIACNLSSLLAELHSHQHFVVDFKPENIQVFRGIHVVAILDCDSFSIQSIGRKSFPATNFSSEYIAPEALKSNLPPQSLYGHQDRFALAIILFKLMNNGIHPYQGILKNAANSLATNDEKVREGYYAYGVVPHAAIAPCPQSIHACLNDEIHKMFDQAFTAAEPSERPTAKEWADLFRKLLEEKRLQTCSAHPTDPSHIHFYDKPCGECYFQTFVQAKGRSKEITGSAKNIGVVTAAVAALAVILLAFAIYTFNPGSENATDNLPASRHIASGYATTTTGLHLREGPGSKSPLVAEVPNGLPKDGLPKGSRLKIVSDANNGWSEVEATDSRGKVYRGFVNSKYLDPE